MKNIPRPKGTYADYEKGETEGKVFVFELTKNNKNNPQMAAADTGRPVMFPLSVPLPMVGTIFYKNEKGKTAPRKIRFADGENSIFVDEQTPDDKRPKAIVRANFVNGKYQILGEDSVKLKFFMTWDINETNPNRNEKKSARFRLVDTSKMMASAKQTDMEKFNAAKWCFDAPLDKIMAVAELKLNSEQLVQQADDIRWNLKLIAERSPKEFLAMLEDPKTERRYIIRKAINLDVITVDSRTNGVYWTDNPNNPLIVAAPGKDPIEDFVAKSFSSDGERYYTAIKDAVTPRNEKPVEEISEPVIKPTIVASGADEKELAALVDKAVECGIVTINKTKVWYKYRGSSYMKAAGLIAALKDSEGMLNVFRTDVLNFVPHEV